MKVKKYINYLADCYKSDNREFIIDNFFSSKYENQWIQELDEELINEKFPKQYISDSKGEEIIKNIQLYERDKQAYYCSVFVIGKRKLFSNKTVKICAPIFYYPITLDKKDEHCFIELDTALRQVNYGFLRSLKYIESFEAFLEEFEILLEQKAIDYPFLAKLRRLMQKHTLAIDFDDSISTYPKLIQEKELKKAVNKRTGEFDQYKIKTSSGILVSSKANNIQSVVNELEELRNTDDYSAIINAYLGEGNNTQQEEYKLKIKPFILNTAQENIVKAANEQVKSVVIGPPGTGKTYTVGAIAMDYLSQGKSVLIATKTAEALQVISNKLDEFSVGKYRIKVGGSKYKKTLLSTLKQYTNDVNNSNIQSLRQYGNVEKLYNSEYRLKKIENQFHKLSEESKKLTEGVLIADGIIAKIKKRWMELFQKQNNEEWELLTEYFEELKSYLRISNKYLEVTVYASILQNVKNHWNEWKNLIKIIDDNEVSLKSTKLDAIDFDVILKALPIWLVKIDEVSEALPMKKEMFDLLIIDEATQCDMAGILPLMQRAKKVVVTGDTKQLKHMSFLSKTQMKNLVQKHEIQWSESLNYRSKSLLDYVLENTNSRKQINTLNEHYRSLPGIIQYSNRKFYGDGLTVMSDLPKHKEEKGVKILNTEGVRDKGVNHLEASSIVKYIQYIIEREKSIAARSSTSIGVISPFRDQVTYIGKVLKEEFSIKELEKHEIRIGTPYAFQGDERDIILISIAVDKESHFSALNYLNKEDVFNVMITRARNEQRIFTSIWPHELKHDSLLREYLEEVEIDVITKTSNSEVFLDQFTEEVTTYLGQLEIKYYIGYQLSGIILDIMLEYNGAYYGIDLIGYPGEYQETFSMERYKVLHRVGIQVIPLSYVTWYFDKDIKLKLSNILQHKN